MKHDILKIYWERMGKPALEFKYADDPWLPVQGTPSFNPAFEYRFVSQSSRFAAGFVSQSSRFATEFKPEDSFYYKQGYAHALEDMKAEVERMATAKRCLLKNST